MSSSSELRENRGFAREIKFLVPPGSAEMIRQWARERMDPDPHGAGPSGDVYRIASLYFDTPEFDVYRRNGSFGRAKYRIRRYGDGRKAYLERKLKSRDMVSKRRSAVKVREFDSLEDGAANREWPGFWFHRRLLLRGLSPVCQISYVRTARVAENGFGVARLTLDQDLRALPASRFGFDDFEDGTPITDGQVIVEMKYRREMPPVFERLAEEFGLVQQPLSKYRLAAAALGLVPEPANAQVQTAGSPGSWLPVSLERQTS